MGRHLRRRPEFAATRRTANCARNSVDPCNEQTTCCAFAGPGMHRLYVTTATEHWTDEQRRAEPGAGVVYAFATDATGRPAAPFRPDPTWWAATVIG